MKNKRREKILYILSVVCPFVSILLGGILIYAFMNRSQWRDTFAFFFIFLFPLCLSFTPLFDLNENDRVEYIPY